MPLLRLYSGAYKAQSPAKSHLVNADMTMSDQHFVGALDGVSGVTELGLKPEDLPYHLREHAPYLLIHKHRATNK